ncbi:hypothetical protein CACET_c21330 [Clostridium aceticum]|uniref:Uncharacterized protein n=1 Tax=Clostridium aceticum TaxID=84022 RepID=A0A0D8I9Y2_9CLOT|nr:hypothetical protein [Clostridium aceticum]AKL95580.1 hypothetical protein CACET_c21330 [Clostridium aceticum]KJF26844.1 hypothetical protein TZ02_11600 [Clostridium aceticum]
MTKETKNNQVSNKIIVMIIGLAILMGMLTSAIVVFFLFQNEKLDQSEPRKNIEIKKIDATVENTLEKFKEKDASYLGTDEFGKDLEEVSKELYANASDTGGYTNEEERVWKYIMDRWSYYDDLEGGYAGDKYTKQVFQDASIRFNITASEAERIWNKVDRAKLGIY